MIERIRQTNRTILFEEFDYENGNNLINILDDPTVDNKIKFNKKIKDLEVESFDEFLKKFTPKIYETYEVAADGSPKVIYTTEHIEGAVEVTLTNHAFYKFVNNLYEKKKTSGQDNFEFNYDDVKEILTPENDVKEIKAIRSKLQYNYKEYMKLEKEGLPSQEKKIYAKKIKELRKEVINKYQKSPIGLLPLALTDINKQLESIESNKNAILGDSNDKVLKIGNIGFDEEGDLKVYMIESKSFSEEKEENEDTKLLTTCIENDFEKNAPDNLKNDFVKGLVVSSYCSDSQIVTMKSKEELTIKKEKYQNIYKQSQEAFIKTLSILVEKILGVRIFFEHATTNGILSPKLVVSNCSIERIIMNKDIKDKLEKYLKDFSEENDYKFWFSIIPAVADSNNLEESNEVLENDDPFGDFDIEEEDENINVNLNQKEFVSLYATKTMLKLLKNAKIMTFFNFKANEDTGFYNLTEKKLLEYKDRLKDLNNEYAVFTYPNFTILPSNENVIKIGERESDDISGKEAVYIKLHGIYIESSYVAAGLMVACQTHKFLKSKGYKIKNEIPCVRFDIEDNDNNKRILTSMNREMSLKWDSDVEKEIIKDAFGFSFCSNEIYYKNNLINNCYIFMARTMSKSEKNNKYKKLYKTILKDCIANCLKTEGKLTKAKIEKFKKEEVKQWTRDAEESNENTITMLKKGEDIKFENEKLSLKFIDDDEIIDELYIEED